MSNRGRKRHQCRVFMECSSPIDRITGHGYSHTSNNCDARPVVHREIHDFEKTMKDSTKHLDGPLVPAAHGRLLIVLAAVLWSLSGGFTKVLTTDTPLGLNSPKLTPERIAFC